jgi:23S rRNA U2552 (ribose-2'-O)-methylase RlmE/FtsJ
MVYTIDDLTIKLPTIGIHKIDINAMFTQKIPVAKRIYGCDDKLEKIKDKLENMQRLWEQFKLIVNPYILVNLSNLEEKHLYNLTKQKFSKTCDVKVLSRAFYKMWEILKTFDLINHKDKSFRSANLAEGPGGFIQAIIYYRTKYNLLNKSNKMIGITLKEAESKGLKFVSQNPIQQQFINKYMTQNKILDISYGNDDGNLNKINVIKNYAKLFEKEKANLVTADGGFPTEYNIKLQEQISTHLIFNEIVTTLSVQKIGGNFVCKTFSLYTKASIEIIYLLCNYYDNIYITKPVTSRITNTEHYIVGKGFRGIEKQELDKLYDITKEWYEKDKTGGIIMPKYFLEKFIVNPIPKNIEITMKKYNEKINKIQFEKIKQVDNLVNDDVNTYINMLNYSKKISENWCSKYDL